MHSGLGKYKLTANKKSFILAYLQQGIRKLSSSPRLDGEEEPTRHCCTCSCPQEFHPLPPPLPKPNYSVYKRVLPDTLTSLSSPRGRKLLMESLSSSPDSPYWCLTEHFQNQSDPAFCGVTTLIMILNSLAMDPQIRWRGGWRFYGSEDVLISKCCISDERIRRIGITMEEFQQLAQCQGMRVEMKRPDGIESLEAFRRDVKFANANGGEKMIRLVCSFSRSSLGQTGDGHFSPVGAYHEHSDSVLIMDVARFKYPPYWVSLIDLYEAMVPLDEASQQPRGWFLMTAPPRHQNYKEEYRRPASLVPLVGEPDICPIGEIKVQFCKIGTISKDHDNS
jgi:glutathione gamma-glutamylcysteinyltransferase